MKKSLFMFAFLFMIGLSNSFANGEESVSKKVLDAFRSEFSGATNVSWETSRNFNKATFSISGQIMFAYYDHAGEFLATIRNITSSQLPIQLLADLKSDYGQYWISDLFELTADNGTHYYVKVENVDHSIVLKSISSKWSMFKKEKK